MLKRGAGKVDNVWIVGSREKRWKDIMGDRGGEGGEGRGNSSYCASIYLRVPGYPG